MRAHDGLLVVALLLVALAAGCRDDRQEDTQTRTAAKPQARPAPASTETAGTDDRTPESETVAESQPPAAATDEPGDAEVEPATAELRRARQELHDLAEETVSLREALLEARFKAPEKQTSAGRGGDHDNR